jgi:hypothetical protein
MLVNSRGRDLQKNGEEQDKESKQEYQAFNPLSCKSGQYRIPLVLEVSQVKAFLVEYSLVGYWGQKRLLNQLFNKSQLVILIA